MKTMWMPKEIKYKNLFKRLFFEPKYTWHNIVLNKDKLYIDGEEIKYKRDIYNCLFDLGFPNNWIFYFSQQKEEMK